VRQKRASGVRQRGLVRPKIEKKKKKKKKERDKPGLGIREKKWPKWCSFRISGTGPKPVQPVQFTVFIVEPPVFGFWPIFLIFRFFQRT
jgi:hypothetical protein